MDELTQKRSAPSMQHRVEIILWIEHWLPKFNIQNIDHNIQPFRYLAYQKRS